VINLGFFLRFFVNRAPGNFTIKWSDLRNFFTFWSYWFYAFMHIFRSALRSRPNKASLKCPSLRTSVRPQKNLFDFNENWLEGRGRWVMHDGMQYDPIQDQGQGHELLTVGNPSIFKSFSSAIYNVCWQLTTDS